MELGKYATSSFADIIPSPRQRPSIETWSILEPAWTPKQHTFLNNEVMIKKETTKLNSNSSTIFQEKLTLVANFLRSIVSHWGDFTADAATTVITRNFLTYFVCTDRDANCTEYVTACIKVAQEFECSTGAHFRRAGETQCCVGQTELNGQLTRRWMQAVFHTSTAPLRMATELNNYSGVWIFSSDDHTVFQLPSKTNGG